MTRILSLCLAGACAAIFGGAAPVRAADWVWWEGESPRKTNFPKKSWFSASGFPRARHLLSGGAWLSNSGKRTGAQAFAVYDVKVPAESEYGLWARKFWKHGPFRWRFDRGPWRTCGRDIALADTTPLRKNVCANWVFLGKVKLKKGLRVFEIRLQAQKGQSLTAAFDCFLLTRGPFMPKGKRRPGEKSGLAEKGWFAWEPGVDDFRPEALLDLRPLNEKVAGERGFVRRRGAELVLGGGSPVRFWAVNVSGNNAAQGRESVDYLARRLAKLGVNMVRYHGPLFDRGRDPAKIDPKAMDNLFYLVAAMKARGIYTELSFYFPLWFDVKPHYGIAGFDKQKNKKPFALLFFDPRMQDIHRSWLRQLLTTKNPYTGRTLAKETALAIVEIVNEDSYFFWTFTRKNIPEVHWRRLEGIFAQWLAKRHGSLGEAMARWGKARLPGDAPKAGRVRLFEAWHMTSAGLERASVGRKRRISDQVRFLAAHQREFYASTTRFIKKTLGYGGLVSAGNWHVSDAGLLDGLERWTYTAADVIDRHGYFGGRHTGEGSHYSVRVGHVFGDRAGVTVPQRLPIQVDQVAGFPHIISELGWTAPNRYRGEATFLTAAYAGLQGIDGVFFFAVASNSLSDSSMRKFPVGTPVLAGSFPACALMYRRGDVAEGKPAVRRALRLEDLYALKGSGAAAQGLDELRKKDVPVQPSKRSKAPAIDPLSYYVGPVVREIGPKPGKSAFADLGRCIDRAGRTIKSIDGRLVWDYGKGVVRVNTPRAQGAVGFLARAGKIELKDVTIDCRNEFASAIVISLDGKPLGESRKILVQVVTEDKPYGFAAAGGKIVALGGEPFNVRRIDATVTLKLRGAAVPRAVALDGNGYATGKKVSLRRTQPRGDLSIELSPDAIYHVLTR